LGKQKDDMMLSLDEVTADMLGTKVDGHFDSSNAITMKLQQAILHLPAKQQLAFNLRYYDEMSYEEIAEVAGSTAASMKVSYNIAKEKIIAYMNYND
jgi:RNA polymerase sigma-70 factor (ECF subfamily)